jgi:hypothetical protein
MQVVIVVAVWLAQLLHTLSVILYKAHVVQILIVVLMPLQVMLVVALMPQQPQKPLPKVVLPVL